MPLALIVSDDTGHGIAANCRSADDAGFSVAERMRRFVALSLRLPSVCDDAFAAEFADFVVDTRLSLDARSSMFDVGAMLFE